jgi:hypothetical protein
LSRNSFVTSSHSNRPYFPSTLTVFRVFNRRKHEKAKSSSEQTVIEVSRCNQIMTSPSFTMQSSREKCKPLRASRREASNIPLTSALVNASECVMPKRHVSFSLKSALQAMISHLNGMNPLFAKRRMQSLSRSFCLSSRFRPFLLFVSMSDGNIKRHCGSKKLFQCNSSMLFRSFEVKLL